MQPERDLFLDALNARIADGPPDPAWDDFCVSMYAQVRTMRWLAGELAAHHGVNHAAAFNALDSLGPNLAGLLQSPQGMILLGVATGGVLGSPQPDPFAPVVH